MHVITVISTWIIPCFILVVLVTATVRKVPTYELFVEGGKSGIDLAWTLLPFLLGMVVAIAILQSSGALDAFVGLFSPVFHHFGIPPDIVPLAIVRPISGTAALGMMSELTRIHGPDSLIGRLAATMQGSTDTTLYIITVYFGAVGIKKMRYALKVGLLADVIGLIVAIVIVRMVFT